MTDFAFGVTVTRQRAGERPDPYSGLSTQDDWEHPLEEDFEDCAAWMESSTEVAPAGSELRTRVVTIFKVALPYNADVVSTDRLVIPGLGKVEVKGEVERWKHPMTGWEAGSIAIGMRIDG